MRQTQGVLQVSRAVLLHFLLSQDLRGEVGLMEQLSLIENEQITPRSGAKNYKENVLERKEREHIDENIQRFLQLQQLPYESKLSHAAKMASITGAYSLLTTL